MRPRQAMAVPQLLLLRDGRTVRCVASDSEVVAAFVTLHLASVRMRELGVPHWADDEYPLSGLGALRDRGELVGGFEGGRLCATMQVLTTDPEFWHDAGPREAAYIHKLAVAPDVAGTGWPDLLLDWAALFALGQRRPHLRLDTVPGPLVAFYEQRGFRSLGAWPCERIGRPVVRMQAGRDRPAT